jgi:tetratricopeptide (TPR) repeat protein
VIEKIPLLVLAAASCVVTCIAQQSKGAMAMLSVDVSLPIRLLNALVSYVAYLGKTVWPERLIIFYPYPAERPLWQAALAAVFLIAVTAAAIWAWRKRPYLAVGWFWYLGTLVPVIGLVQVGAQAMADRYTYIPLIGIFIAVVWGIGDLTAGRRRQRVVAAALAVSAIGACMILSAWQTAHWADSQSLFTYVLDVSPDNAVGHCNLGDELLRQNRYAEAETHYRELARIEPKARAYAQLMWGQTLAKRDRPGEAVSHFREAVRLDPDMAIAHFDLAMALAEVGKPQEVIEHLYTAARLARDKPEALNNLAWFLTHCPDRNLRDAAKAVELAERAVRLSDRQEPGYLATLAVAYTEAGRPSEALQVAEEAIGLAAIQKKAAPADALRVRMEVHSAGSSRRRTPQPPVDSARP